MDALDPIAAFHAWFAEAQASEPDVPEAMQLATVSPEGLPRCRTVLLKGVDARGFVFYTNTRSRKGADLAAHAHAALTFHWKSLERQVHVEGPVVPVDDAEADAYFASRPRGSQVGAWASQQSEPLAGREALEAAVRAVEARFEGREVPRPPHWHGFRVVPHRIELWQGHASRLHHRVVFTRSSTDAAWGQQLLQP